MKAWLKLGSVALLGGLIAGACTVKSGDDDVTTGGSGGSSTGGRTSTGGTTTTGGSSTGGSTTTGGTTAVDTSTCDPATGDLNSTPGSCEPDDMTNTCAVCLKTNCCTEVQNCGGTNPDNVCGYGGPAMDGMFLGEFVVLQACLQDRAKRAPDGFYTEQDQSECLDAAASPKCGGVAGNRTLDLFNCTQMNCDNECFNATK